ncbi:MAG: hypothetical protein WC379_07085 [Methanoregula sp.]|jgi:hypothetical protein
MAKKNEREAGNARSGLGPVPEDFVVIPGIREDTIDLFSRVPVHLLNAFIGELENHADRFSFEESEYEEEPLPGDLPGDLDPELYEG